MLPMIEIITSKPNALSVSFRILEYISIRAQQTNTNNDDQVARAPLNQFFANRFKCIPREKSRVFVLKVATSGPHLIIL